MTWFRRGQMVSSISTFLIRTEDKIVPLSFFLDQSGVRSNLVEFVQRSSRNALLLTKEGVTPWAGTFPCRVGGEFYGSPWVIYSDMAEGAPVGDLSVFSADRSKSPGEAMAALTRLANSADWAIFPWGGYFRYGMLGLIAGKHVGEQAALDPVFQYASVEKFDQSYRALIARRNRVQLASSLWSALAGESAPPLIVTFEYYESAFADAKLSFSVEGTFTERDGTSRVSVYRVRNYETFEYFVKMSNQVSVFDILPSTLSVDSCAKVRRMADGLELGEALRHTPWFLVYNGGEIDTNHVLFAASEHSITAQFAVKSADALEVISYL